LFPVVDGCTFKEDFVSSKKRKINSSKARVHLAEQLCMILPGLMEYIKANPGLDYSLKTGEEPFELVFTWTYKGERPDSQWQGKIFAKVTESLGGTNLFICPENTGPKGEYVVDLRIDKYDTVSDILENNIVVPIFNDLTQKY
jgi:hypothetical protein